MLCYEKLWKFIEYLCHSIYTLLTYERNSLTGDAVNDSNSVLDCFKWVTLLFLLNHSVKRITHEFYIFSILIHKLSIWFQFFWVYFNYNIHFAYKWKKLSHSDAVMIKSNVSDWFKLVTNFSELLISLIFGIKVRWSCFILLIRYKNWSIRVVYLLIIVYYTGRFCM